MNILFITIGRLDSIYEKEIYPDLMRYLSEEGHRITVLRISTDASKVKKSGLVTIYNKRIKGIRGNVSSVQKGIAYLRYPIECIRFIEKQPKFDIVIASTPPVSVSFVFSYLKRKKVKTYLLQKDIFPEDAIDLEILNKRGIKGIIYYFFRFCENRLYKNSSFVGAMSQGCVDYLIRHNTNVDTRKFEVNPNSIIPTGKYLTKQEKNSIRQEYNLPEEKVIFVYGGNIGDAQGIDFIDKVLSKINNKKVMFLFLGDGCGFDFLKGKYKDSESVCFRPPMSSKEYYRLVGCCDVGLVFLSSKLTVPNVPSRMLFYMDNYVPILAAVDLVSDIYSIINNEKVGLCCHSIDEELELFAEYIERMIDENNRITMGHNSKKYLVENWSCEISANIMLNHFGENK